MRKSTFKKILVRGLALLGGVNLLCTAVSVITIIVIFVAVVMGHNPTKSPIEAFAYGYLRPAYATHWSVTVATVISMIWTFLWAWNEQNKNAKKNAKKKYKKK